MHFLQQFVWTALFNIYLFNINNLKKQPIIFYTSFFFDAMNKYALKMNFVSCDITTPKIKQLYIIFYSRWN